MLRSKSESLVLSKARMASCSLVLFLVLCGCGRKGSPRPPEVFSPRAVKELHVHADLDGVHFDWKAPELDQRGKELKSMGGYKIYRREVNSRAEIQDRYLEYETLIAIPDTHIEKLRMLREKAKEEGKITRRVKVDDEDLEFSYVDASVEPGVIYLYKLVPFNQGDVEGLVRNLVYVNFRGDASEVSLIEESDFDAFSF